MERRNKGSRNCQYCSGNSVGDPTHEVSASHKYNYLLWNWNKNRKSLVKNRHGIEVLVSHKGRPLNHDVNNGRHYFKITPQKFLDLENNIDFRCTVKNTRSTSIHLTYANVLLPYTWFSFHDSNNNNAGRSLKIEPGKSHSVIIRFTNDDAAVLGSYNIPVCFSLQTISQKVEIFHIVRAINVSVTEDLEENFEVIESPFKGAPWPREVIILPPTSKQRFCDLYRIPLEYKKFLIYNLEEFHGMRGPDFKMLTELRLRLEPGNVTAKNYKAFWDLVLWLEEMQQALGLQQYNMENVQLNLLDSSRVELFVPGLAEKRPSVIVGDMVDLRIHEDHTGYRGEIKRVNNNTVEIGALDDECLCILESSKQMREDIDVKFVLSRLGLERQHQGVQCVERNGLLPYLFPPENPNRKVTTKFRTITDGEFFNEIIMHNQEQKTAVVNILNATSSPYPYIVFGPPGTGKTVTIVEAILQIMKKTTHHILVCAPSNAACDVITEKLQEHCSTDELIRIFSQTVDITTVHKVILPHSNYEGEGVFRQIFPEDLSDYRIVVATLTLAGKFTGNYHPDVLFIDEAAQACEPEACCAIGLLNRGAQIILAGDPEQLGPSLSSETAVKYGLGISLLERLKEYNIYNGNDLNYTTMLVQNFRNHSKILELPNKLFYNDKLRAMSARSELDPISKIFIFPNIKDLQKKQKKKRKQPQGHPIEFCSLISEESREGQSPSYYNMIELQMTLKYIQTLLKLEFEDDDYKVVQTDIGVVTPYVRQVHKMKGLLKQNGLESVEVGTTETFQGREKRIIIISTVRAKEDLLLEDKKFKLGFVNNKKRFNVALTRAMSKLIVIGCGHVLATDEKWLKYIDLCEDLRGVCGAPMVRRTSNTITDVTGRIEPIKVDTQFEHQNKDNSKK